jgi:nucleotide-binding universal stress UspA family protein
MKLDTILVPLDGSALAETALPAAAELARDSGARLLLLRAVEVPTRQGVDPIDAQVNAVEEAEGYLREVAERLVTQGVLKVKLTVWYGSPIWVIPEVTRRLPVSLIVMTSHGRSGLGRFVIGSVAESVLRSTATPLLLIRPEGAPVAPGQAGQGYPWPVGEYVRGFRKGTPAAA